MNFSPLTDWSWKILGIVTLIVLGGWQCYRIGYNKAFVEGELALQTFKLEQALLIIDAQNEVKVVYEQKMQNLVAAHDAERNVYDERVRQLKQFRSASTDLAACRNQRDRLAELAIRGERLLKRADAYIKTLKD